MTETTDSPKFKFLPDSPVTKDEFGSHARVAESIAQQVEFDRPGMSISLEGTWGSGKSSIISMLEDRWKKRNDIKVFTFDAWAHEGDSLRRSFLEELILFLQRPNDGTDAWLPAKIESCDRPRGDCCACVSWQTCRPDLIRDELRHRREDSTIVSEPKITQWGIWFAICTLVMPIGVALLAASRNLTDWHLYIGLFTAAAPLLWILAFIFYRLFTHQKGDKYLAEIVGKTKDITTHSTHRGIEPTSIEFAAYYSEIMEFSLADKDNRRLVIVLDNLDRVGGDAALKAWATMRTFLRPGHAPLRSHREKVWLIVPYDPGAIRQLWARPKDAEEAGGGTRGNDNMGAGLARTFMEKTFQIKYRVAPPLASRWEVFFKHHLQIALEGASDNDLRAVYHVFRIQALPAYKRETPTPREMKIFINRVVALAQQHLSEVGLPEIALYAALELNGKDLLDGLAANPLGSKEKLSDYLTPKWKESLAAIHYGVPRKDAAEVLYGPEFSHILQKGNAEAMHKLVAEVPAQQCCERYLRDKAPEMDFTAVLAASRAFGKYDPQSAPEPLKHAIDRLAYRLSRFDGGEWAIIGGRLDKTSATDIVRLLQFKPGIGRNIADRLNVSVTAPAEVEKIDAGLPKWVGGASLIVSELANGKGFDGITIEMPDPPRYQAILDLLAKDDQGQKVIHFFQPAPELKKAYLEQLVLHIRDGAFREEDRHVLAGMQRMSCWDHKDTAKIVSSAVQQCLSRDNIDKDVLCLAVNFLFEQAVTGDAAEDFKTALRNYCASAYLCGALHQHRGDVEATLCMTLLLLHNPRPKFPGVELAEQGIQRYEKLLANSNKKMAHEVAMTCIENQLTSDILGSIMVGGLEDKPFVAILLAELVSIDTELKAITSDVFLGHHDLFHGALDKDGDGDAPNQYEELVRRLLHTKEGSLLQALESKDIDLDLMRTYYLAIKADDLDTSSLEETIWNYLHDDVGQDQWLTELRNNSCTLDVMLHLHQKPKGLSLDQRYSYALIDHAILMRDNDSSIVNGDLADKWPNLLGCIAKHEKEPFQLGLIRCAVGDGRKPLTRMIPIYGEELQEAFACVHKKSDKQAIEAKLVQLADQKDHVHLDWLLRLLAERMDVSSMSKNNISALRGRLEGYLKTILSSNGSDEESDDGGEAQSENTFSIDHGKARKLAEDLGIDLEEGESAPEEDEATEAVDE